MKVRLKGKIQTLLTCLAFAALSLNAPAGAESQDASRLQELLYGEALFYWHQQEYLSAINSLQVAQAQGLLSPSSDDTRLLLAQMKLAYGMHLDAGFDLHALLGSGVPPLVRNRAWYELARAFSHKGYNEAADEALAHIQGELPADIVGDCQLLKATVLMSLNKNGEAAQALAQWRGAPELAAYAHYNRGMALMRTGDYLQVVPALELAVGMPAKEDELLALRDKARLALGYIFAREEEYKRARKQLKAVQPDGPFSNRALLALGWISYKQGHSESALISWTELRSRSPSDPAVLETLLVVPAVQREMDALQTATLNYEAATMTYNKELDYLNDAREAVQRGNAVSLLLQDNNASGQNAEGLTSQGTARFFGSLLASRDFKEMLQDHGELLFMLDKLDQGLQEIEILDQDRPSEEQKAARSTAAVSGAPVTRQRTGPNNGIGTLDSPGQHVGGNRGDPQLQQQWVRRSMDPGDEPTANIPQLPEIESPAHRVLKPLPERELSRPPPVSQFIRDPPGSEIFGLPESEILWLPNSGEFFGRPRSGEFFRRPGEETEEDYAYPDKLPRRRSMPGSRYAYQLHSLAPADGEETGFVPGAVPVGEALRELAGALNDSTQRMAQLGDPVDLPTGMEDREQLVAALRARIIKLRERIANAVSLYENYTREMALDALDRRQHLLEGLLEQASLELAKTYDQNNDQ